MCVCVCVCVCVFGTEGGGWGGCAPFDFILTLTFTRLFVFFITLELLAGTCQEYTQHSVQPQLFSS